MIVYSIRESHPPDNILRLGFSVWARNYAKNYLSLYPKAAKDAQTISKSDNVYLYSLVDDIWPLVSLQRSQNEQEDITKNFLVQLQIFGFDEIHLVSKIVEKTSPGNFLPLASKFTISEFGKILPQSKKVEFEKLNLSEILGFLWHIYVLNIAFKKFQLNGLLVGIRSEFFYLASRKLLPPHDVYFVKTI